MKTPTEKERSNPYKGKAEGLRLTIGSAKRGPYDHCGFQMTFGNGWTISVQWSEGSYAQWCDRVSPDESTTAECAVWDGDGEWFRLTEHDDVRGHMTPDQVVELMAEVASKPSNEKS